MTSLSAPLSIRKSYAPIYPDLSKKPQGSQEPGKLEPEKTVKPRPYVNPEQVQEGVPQQKGGTPNGYVMNKEPVPDQEINSSLSGLKTTKEYPGASNTLILKTIDKYYKNPK